MRTERSTRIGSTEVAIAHIAPDSASSEPDVLAHAPGWTLYRNLYMSNWTHFIVTDDKGRRRIPEIQMMVRTWMEATVQPENIAAKELTPHVMHVVSPQEAKTRWTSLTGDAKKLNLNWTVEGTQ
jgi:hypothetical protein